MDRQTTYITRQSNYICREWIVDHAARVIVTVVVAALLAVIAGLVAGILGWRGPASARPTAAVGFTAAGVAFFGTIAAAGELGLV
jgi:hypothetical protein